ncbi:MAG: hypothetical protein H0Z34_09955 [Brevibacillus sp.]|nr:hypothetical protein [Brevibacillus sp.]
MELLWFLVVLICSYTAYLIEKRRWTTLVRTTDRERYLQWRTYLDHRGIPYRAKVYTTVQENEIVTIYKIKVLSRQVSRLKAP